MAGRPFCGSDNFGCHKPPLDPHWRSPKAIWAKYSVHIWHSIWSNVERRDKGGWISHRSCLSTASGWMLTSNKRAGQSWGACIDVSVALWVKCAVSKWPFVNYAAVTVLFSGLRKMCDVKLFPAGRIRKFFFFLSPSEEFLRYQEIQTNSLSRTQVENCWKWFFAVKMVMSINTPMPVNANPKHSWARSTEYIPLTANCYSHNQ